MADGPLGAALFVECDMNCGTLVLYTQLGLNSLYTDDDQEG